jgi:hypothetical protein
LFFLDGSPCNWGTWSGLGNCGRRRYEKGTLRRNREDLQSFALLPCVLDDVSERSLSTELVGAPAAIPVALAPVGALDLTWVNGEIAAARAAKAHGVDYHIGLGQLELYTERSMIFPAQLRAFFTRS